jgi:hypothetical protein
MNDDGHLEPTAETDWRLHRSRHGGADEIPLPRTTGRLWLCGKHFVGPDPEAAIKQLGVSAIVCLNPRAELEHRYPDYVAWLTTQPASRVVWFPIADLGAPTLSLARPLLDQLGARLEGGQTLLLHCGAGIGRAGTIAAAVLMHLGADFDDALHVVASHRPMAGPEAGAQRDLLRALATLNPA